MVNKVIDGIGKDAEVIVGANGGMQSKSPSAMHLVDATFLRETVVFVTNHPSTYKVVEGTNSYNALQAVEAVASYMKQLQIADLHLAVRRLGGNDFVKTLLDIGAVLQYGVEHGNGGKGYPTNNWRLIPREENINHALIHLLALVAGDTQDDHKEHALCRLMMAIATEESAGFSYTKYMG